MGADEATLKKMEAAMKKGKGAKPAASGHFGMKGKMGGMMSRKEYSPEQIEFATAITEVERALKNVNAYKEALRNSPGAELSSMMNALSGGYIAPTSGGDPVLNPNILPTGRNMFAVNAEEAPSAVAWEKGKSLADNTIAMYRKAHGDSIPRKVSYTLWSSEFIETEGATIAQVLYMLGVEPVRDPFGRVTDLKLIPSKELGRPRIDVVVQTSGQLRDLAASRLFLISRAVKMAAEADDKDYPNFVADGVVESERHLVDKGVSPKEARELSTARVFGGVNGNYGSGIQGMVEAGDRWENSSEIARTYINNMGAIYGSEEDWEKMRDYAFEAALTSTDVVVQPRQSNTWGALSLDHVYEFMGGMNLAVKNVTGKDPDAYLSDYRNRNHARMQEVKEAIGVESRTTILNPAYIRNKMKGGAGDASGFADIVRNTYGWNVMKPDVIDNELWDDIYDTYVKDKFNLGTKDYFTSKNPAAIEEITAVMLETARKGMWNATAEQIKTLAELHTEIVNEYQPSCSGFVCDNAKLREFISSNVSKATAAQYNQNIGTIRAENTGSDNDGMVMQKEELNAMDKITSHINGIIVGAVVLIALVLMVFFIRRRKNNQRNNGDSNNYNNVIGRFQCSTETDLSSLWGQATVYLVLALFTGMSLKYAISQSKIQIDIWINDPELMLDIAVLLTADVFLQISFCVLSAKRLAGEYLSKTNIIFQAVTQWIPGILIFPVLLALLVEVIFAFPGMSFSAIAWTLASAVFLTGVVLSCIFKWILPEKDLRLELIFMINALIALLGVIATVNGRTAVAGIDSVEWKTLAGVMAVLIAGAAAGYIIFKRKQNKIQYNERNI